MIFATVLLQNIP